MLALPRIGKVAAATTATALIARFRVRAMLFTGVTGGLALGVRVGDVVVAGGLLRHEMDASPLFARYEVPLLKRSVCATNAVLTTQLQHICALALNAWALPGPRLTVHAGVVVNGDRFFSGTLEGATLANDLQRAGHRPLAGEKEMDMEGVAVTHNFHAFVKDVASICAQTTVRFWLNLLLK